MKALPGFFIVTGKTKTQSLPTPLLWPAVFWVSGLLAAYYLQPHKHYITALTAILFGVAIFARKLRPILILLIVAALGILRVPGTDGQNNALAEILESQGRVQQDAIFEVGNSLGEQSYEIRLFELVGYEVDESLLLYSGTRLSPGSSYSALLEIHPPSNDPILQSLAQRSDAIARAVGTIALAPKQHKTGLIHRARTRVKQRMELALGSYAPLANALLLGDTQYKREYRADLSRAGITHLIVVSGLHVLLLSVILILVLRALVPPVVADLIYLVLLVTFATLNLWAAPIMRAGLMILLLILARRLCRPLSLAQNLALSLFIITIISPREILSLSLQFSFVAVALIAFVLPRFRRHKDSSLLIRYSQSIGSYILLTIVVGIGLAPLSLYYFGSASLNGILANLLALPMVAVLLCLSLMILILPVTPFILVFEFVSDLWQIWMELCASLPLTISGHWISLTQAVALAVWILSLLLFLKVRNRRCLRSLLPASLLLLIVWWWPHQQRNEIYVFNSGVSDCSLIFADDGSSLMIDTGGVLGQRAESPLLMDIRGRSWLNRDLSRWLARKRIRSLDYLIITHLHSDHAGGLQDLLEQLQIKNLILSNFSLQSEEGEALMTNPNLQNTEIIAISDTCSIYIGSHRLKILHPDAKYRREDLNNQSIVCRYDADSGRYLFTGDIEKHAEQYLVDRYPQELKAHFLKVAHHGSRSSSTDEFLSKVYPELAVIPVSKRNIYGFPHPQAMQRLHKHTREIRQTHEGSLRLELVPVPKD